MNLKHKTLSSADRTSTIRRSLAEGWRLGLITSIDGNQLLTLLLNPETSEIDCFETPVHDGLYTSLTPRIPQAHWFERTTWDMFGLTPSGHPRLKHSHLHEAAGLSAPPLAGENAEAVEHFYDFLHVEGPGIYEIPVGPIHAGIIEPGHFRFSCYGEVIVNLEIRLGYLHRGVEKRLLSLPWRQTRFLVEAAASDMPVANAVAHAGAIESLLEVKLPEPLLKLRTIALEVERVAMHISDLGGLAGDVGFLAISSSMARIRGIALRVGELLAGNRLMRSYILPGGVSRLSDDRSFKEVVELVLRLRLELEPVIEFFLDNQVVADRMEGVGKLSNHLAADFGLVGVAARASGIDYDCRQSWTCGIYPDSEFAPVLDNHGDVYARAKVRIKEIGASLAIIERLLDAGDLISGPAAIRIPDKLPPNSTSLGIVESHRGELIHLVVTDEAGAFRRYCIKDASVSNWTGLAIATRNNLVADFPLCNKSFSLSYSGHDL